MISWHSEGFCQESYLISTEVLKEGTRYSNFSSGLSSTLGDAPDDAVDKEVEGLWLMQHLCSFPANISKHEVPLFIFEWVMYTTLWHSGQTLNERIALLHRRLGDRDHWLASERVDQLKVLLNASPLAVNKVHAFVLCA